MVLHTCEIRLSPVKQDPDARDLHWQKKNFPPTLGTVLLMLFWWLTLLLLLLLLSHFSRVQLCATPETAAHQAPPSLGFSWQEHWSELPFPSPMHESEK